MRTLLAGQRHAKDADRIDQVHPLRAVGDVDRRIQVVHEDTDDLAEAEGHDGQVIAAQFQCRGTEQRAEQAGKRGRQRHDEPDRQMDTGLCNFRAEHPQQEVADDRILIDKGFQHHRKLRRGQQRRHVGAERIERDVTEIEQAAETDHDV